VNILNVTVSRVERERGRGRWREGEKERRREGGREGEEEREMERERGRERDRCENTSSVDHQKPLRPSGNSDKLERALGRAHTFAYHKIGH